MSHPDDTKKPKRAWMTPKLEELVVHQSARNPDPGADGGVADCSRT